jgi:hypothetical protein
MTELRSSFKKGLDSYSAWTNCVSFQKQYKTLACSQVASKIYTYYFISQAANIVSYMK